MCLFCFYDEEHNKQNNKTINNNKKENNNKQNKQKTNKQNDKNDANSSPLAGRLVGWLAPDSTNAFKLTYVTISQQKHKQR